MKKNTLILLIFVVFSFIPLLDLFQVGLPITHDGQDHVARIANFYQNLSEGNIIPRWAGNLNWGYGHPILMFLYPSPSYLASFFHALGFSLIDSLKIVFAITFIASGFSMYLWIKEFLGEEAGIVAGALYLFAPYRFVDLYVRGAIGEHVAFVFPPLIFYFLLKLSKKYSYWYLLGGSLSVAGLILSHNAITIMFLPLIVLYAMYLFYHSKNRLFLISHFSFLILLGFGLSSFFWLPAFFEGKYTLRDIVTKGEYAKRFVEFKDFLYAQWNYGGSGQFTVQIGVVHWVVVIGTIVLLLLQKLRFHKVFTLILIVSFFLSLVLMTSVSKPIWETIIILQKFQFPWRILSLTVFLTSVIGGIFVSSLSSKLRGLLLIIIISLLFFNREYWYVKAYLQKEDSFFTGIYNGTTDTGESAPIWSVRFMEQQPKSRIEIIGGAATVIEGKRTSTSHEYTIEAITDVVQIRENTLYFPGWEVRVDGQPTTIEFQSQVNRGVMTFFLSKGKHTVIVNFLDTKLRFIANSISILSLVILIIIYIIRKRKIWRRFQ